MSNGALLRRVPTGNDSQVDQVCRPQQEQFEFLDDHPIICNVSNYGHMVRVDFRKEATTL